eukprot:TRINITY_DN58061_c0_g1_i1.p2 TRINITY_DN58061_c0_g1~~TRINITY_DN58061_c0_g1_i1.p2  ORF type:complete len:451 (+),score=195.41 TRINITY_DN58061_c0_g1_i1:216-1568(+)
MVKIKVLSRSTRENTRDVASDVGKVRRNLDPKLHPLERQVEYQRAKTASKLDRMFAKPFVGALEGHVDTVNVLAKDPTNLSLMLSGGCDGEIKLWNIQKKEQMHSVKGHRGFVNGLVTAPDGAAYFSCSDDKAIRMWDMDGMQQQDAHGEARPVAEYLGEHSFKSLDHHWNKGMLCSAGVNLQLWDITRQQPITTFNWGIEQVTKCRYNKVETDLILTAMSDRSVCIYDSRVEQATQKAVLTMKTNALCWNPMEPMTFICANEDTNIYQFDARMLNRAQLVFVSHVAAVLDVDYSPTGKEMVSGSFDRTIRLWKTDICDGTSRDIYHTKRMRRVGAIEWTLDNNYIISGSDDMNVRIWKSQASAPLKHLFLREKKKIEYGEKLRQRFGEFSEIKKINNQRLIPKAIKIAQKKKRVMAEARRRNLVNRQQNTKKILEGPTIKKDVVLETPQ